MTEADPFWLTAEDLIDVHARQLRVFGGAPALRDVGALESAVARPINRWRYENTPLPGLAAAYAYGIVRNHPFVDGNKRVGFLALAGFLVLNGLRFTPSQEDVVATILALAAGDLDEAALDRWIRNNL